MGAGITGLTAALLLQRAGKKCVVVDAHHAGYGTTGGTTAHINTFADTSYSDVEKDFGQDGAKQFADAIKKSVNLIHELVTTYAIDCDFEWKRAYLYAETDQEAEELDQIFDATVRVNVAVKYTSDAPARSPYKKALVYERQAQFHPLKYILGLQKEFIALGGAVLEETLIDEITTENGVHTAKSDNREIKGKSVFYATHIPPGGINVLHFRNAPYRSYVIAAKLRDEASYPADLIYDMQDPYHYYRTHEIDGQKYLVAGGHDHKTGHGDPEQSFADLINYVSGQYAIEEVTTKWSAQYYIPADGLPYIGHMPGVPEGTYTATGYNGNGIILGTVGAFVVSDLILEGESEYGKLFDPARIKPIAGFSEFVKENADVAAKFVRDRFAIEDIDSFAQVPAGTGEVVEYEGEKLAVYKNDEGRVHALNPVCTHAGCIVQWNNSEKSWDCPCHGARYNIEGQVLTVPARRDLEKVQVKS